MSRRKIQFCQYVLNDIGSNIGFVDVGSGGELKTPWNLLPPEKIHKFDFDPETLREEGLPVCISNQVGQRDFYLATSPRSSSLHKSSPVFTGRFDFTHLTTKEKVQVMCTTLDQQFANCFDSVDLMDINAEGHDFQVLQGAGRLLSDGFVKCIKVEFELVEVWQGQGWFSDIDALLREKQYDLTDIDIEYKRPATVTLVHHRGEPLWGKAIYVPGMAYWAQRQKSVDPSIYAEDVLKAVALYTILNMPGRAVDLLNVTGSHIDLGRFNSDEIVSKIFEVFKYARVESVRSGLKNFLLQLPLYAKAAFGRIVN